MLPGRIAPRFWPPGFLLLGENLGEIHGRNLAGIPARFPREEKSRWSKSSRDPAKIPVLILQISVNEKKVNSWTPPNQTWLFQIPCYLKLKISSLADLFFSNLLSVIWSIFSLSLRVLNKREGYSIQDGRMEASNKEQETRESTRFTLQRTNCWEFGIQEENNIGILLRRNAGRQWKLIGTRNKKSSNLVVMSFFKAFRSFNNNNISIIIILV